MSLGFLEVGFQRLTQVVGFGRFCQARERFDQLFLGVVRVAQFVEKRIVQSLCVV